MACAKSTIECVNLVAIIVGLGLSVFSVVLLTADDVDLFSLVPDEAAFAILSLGGLVLLISMLGCCGAMLQKPVLMCCYAVFAFLVILLQIVVIIYTLLNVNGIDTIEGLDNWVGQTQTQVESSLAEWALDSESTEQWAELQTTFQCCGISLESTFELVEEGNDLEDLLTGELCTNTSIAFISNTLSEYNNTYTESAETEASDVLGQSFFCSDAFYYMIQDLTVYIGSFAGLLVFIQLLSFASAINMLFCLSWEDGGFAHYDYEEEEEVLLKSASAAAKEDPRGPAPIPDSFANRVSKRFRFAPAAVLQGEAPNPSLANRMSRSFPARALGGLPAPSAAPDRSAPSLMNRLSARLPMFQPRQPAGPPPGYQGGPAPPASRPASPPQPPAVPSFMKRLSRGFRAPAGPPPARAPGPVGGPPRSAPQQLAPFGGAAKSPRRPSPAERPKPAMGGGRGGLLAEIQGGARLKKTRVNDRSGPAQTGRVV